MKKIPTFFKRDFEGNPSLVTEEVAENCKWVAQGEGIATHKYDGTCVAIINGEYYKRRIVKPNKPEPEGFILEETDKITRKKYGWVKVSPSDEYHWEAWEEGLEDGTYELCGEKINGNPESIIGHVLIKHSEAEIYPELNSIESRTYDSLKEWIKDKDMEGIVFHHPDGRMAKIKKSDFGFKR
jgi:hypothetical protein